MDTRKLLNLAMLGALPVLGLLVWYGSQPPDETQTLLKSPPQADGVTQIKVSWKAQQRSFERTDGVWRINAPISIEANGVQVQKMLQLLTARSLKHFSVSDAEQEKFGFASMALAVDIGGHQVEFGTTEPLHSRRYVRYRGDIHIIDRDIHYLFNLPLERYIALNFLPRDSRILSLAVSDGILAQQDGQWQFQGIDSKADADQITAFIDNWKHGSALEVSSYQGSEGSEIRIRTEREDIVFLLQKDERGYRLARPDLNIQYHLPPDVGDKLFSLASIADIGIGQ